MNTSGLLKHSKAISDSQKVYTDQGQATKQHIPEKSVQRLTHPKDCTNLLESHVPNMPVASVNTVHKNSLTEDFEEGELTDDDMQAGMDSSSRSRNDFQKHSSNKSTDTTGQTCLNSRNNKENNSDSGSEM